MLFLVSFLFDPFINLIRQPQYLLSRFLFAGQFISLLILMLPSKEQKLHYLGFLAHFEIFLVLSIGSGIFLYVIMRQSRRAHTRRFWMVLGLGIVSLFFGYYFALMQALGGIGLTEDGSGMAAVVSPLMKGDWKTFFVEATTVHSGYLTFVAAMIYLSYITSWPLNDIFRKPRRKRGLYDRIIDMGYESVRKHFFKNKMLPIEKMNIRLTNEFASMNYRIGTRIVSFLNFN